MSKKRMAAMMAIVLVMGLCPALAFGAVDDSLAAASVSAQAEKAAKGEEVALQLRADAPNLKYNKNGLVSQNSYLRRGMESSKWWQEVETYKYDSAGHLVMYKRASRLYGYEKNGRIVAYKKKGKQSTVASWKLKYDKKGRLVSQKSSSYSLTYQYSNKDRTVSITATGTSDRTKNERCESKVKLSKTGLVTMVNDVKYRFGSEDGVAASTWRKEYSDTYSYEYDKYGNVKKRKAKHSKWSPFQAANGFGNETCKNSYDKNGTLVSRDGAAISYKSVVVPKKFASAAQAQQKALLNPTLLAPRLGIDSLFNGSYQLIY